MRRRALLRAAGTAAVGGTVALAGCTALGRPDLDAGFAIGTLHPADEEFITGGLRAGGDSRVFATAVPDSAPERIGADADAGLGDVLRNPASEAQFHVVAQLRSTPADPQRIALGTFQRFSWRDWSTLRVRLATEPWGSLADIDPESRRREFQPADELLYTVLWSVKPKVDPLPTSVESVVTER
jgi:hypothetical protein